MERLLAPCQHPWASAGRPGAPGAPTPDPRELLSPALRIRPRAAVNAAIATRVAARGRYAAITTRAAAGLGVLRSAVRRAKCAATASAARPDRRLALLVSLWVSARKFKPREESWPRWTGRTSYQPCRVHEFAAIWRCASRSLTSGAFSVAALPGGGQRCELATRSGNLVSWDRFLI